MLRGMGKEMRSEVGREMGSETAREMGRRWRED